MQQQKTDVASLQSRIDAIQQGIPASSLSTEALAQILDALHLGTDAILKARTRVILAGLRFDKMDYRVQEIEDAHGDTFQWMLNYEGTTHGPGGADDPGDKARHAFQRWLDSSVDDLFFVQGKAGSGKSTLMKFLSEHPVTRQKLEGSGWARGSSVLIASHYFWKPGTDLQSSVFGMYRTLLHHILQAHPQLSPAVLPEHWDDTASVGSAALVPTFSQSQVRTALQRLMTDPAVLGQVDTVLVLFIDGLDEFKARGAAETYEGLASTIKEWAGQSHHRVKICVSSREWPVFLHGFDQYPKLRLQDLTEPDIRQYVQDFFRTNSCFQRWECGNEFRDTLAREIIRRSAGVFLWVTVVLRNLAEGISDGDTEADMRQTLESLPLELEELYAAVLRSIKTDHRESVFSVLRLAQASASSHLPMDLPLVRYYLCDLITENAPRELAHALARFSSLPADDGRALMDKEVDGLARRISARCRGLVEIVSAQDRQPTTTQGYLYHRRVGLFHRTIHDFLASSEAEKVLDYQAKDPETMELWSQSLQAHVQLVMDSPLPHFGWLPDKETKGPVPAESRVRLSIGMLEMELHAFFGSAGISRSPRHLGRDLLASVDQTLQQYPHVSGIVTSEDCAHISCSPSFLRGPCLACRQSTSPSIHHFAVDGFGIPHSREYLERKYRDFAAFAKAPAHRYLLRHKQLNTTVDTMAFFFGMGLSPNYPVCAPHKVHTLGLAAETVWHRCVLFHAVYAHTVEDRFDPRSVFQAYLARGANAQVWFVLGELQRLDRHLDLSFWRAGDFKPRPDDDEAEALDPTEVAWYPVQVYQGEGSQVQPIAHSAFFLHREWSLLRALRSTGSGTAYLHFSDLVFLPADQDVHPTIQRARECPPDEFSSRRVVPDVTWSDDETFHPLEWSSTTVMAFQEPSPNRQFPRGSLWAQALEKKLT